MRYLDILYGNRGAAHPPTPRRVGPRRQDNLLKRLLTKTMLGLTMATGGLMAVPAIVQADQCYVSYHWAYRTVMVKVAYTAYDHCGYPYTAYKWVPTREWYKVYD